MVASSSLLDPQGRDYLVSPAPKGDGIYFVVLGCQYRTALLFTSIWRFLRIACLAACTYVQLLNLSYGAMPELPRKQIVRL
jgi:hypothetical protein